jgi:hypothetical protein
MLGRKLSLLRAVCEHAKWNGHPVVKLLLNVKQTTLREKVVGTLNKTELKGIKTFRQGIRRNE